MAPPTRTALALAAIVSWSSWSAPCKADEASQRIVFLGDSITDGHTYPLLLRQALAEAGARVPVCINAGVGGDTAQGMRKRLQRDVLPHRPTLVALSAGINDALHKVKPADYEADVAAIVEQLRSRHIPVLFLTTTILGPRHAEAEQRLAEYNASLHRLARKYGYRVAEVNQTMRRARDAGARLLEKDQVHLNPAGYRLLTRALLDALGQPKAAVPLALKLSLMPGVVRDWRIRPVPEKHPALDERTVAGLKPDDAWKAYHLPEDRPQPAWWLDQERRRGFALSLYQLVGKGKSYQGMAVLEEKQPRAVYFNTGAQLETIWLNGKKIYQSQGWTGWHAGKERVPARLRAGRNVVVIETGPAFFLSVTGGNRW
jgi:lysophospholipase L1-like esterase